MRDPKPLPKMKPHIATIAAVIKELRTYESTDMGDVVCITSALIDLNSALHYMRCFGRHKSEVHESVRDMEKREKLERQQEHEKNKRDKAYYNRLFGGDTIHRGWESK
jgi:hypothetical protein